MSEWLLINLGWIFSINNIIGAYLNIKKKKLCFIIWSCGNLGFIVQGLFLPAVRPQIPLWIVFTLLNVYGWFMWRKDELKSNSDE